MNQTGNNTDELRAEAQSKLAEAEKAWYAYACECEGPERIKAFEVYENVRNAQRVY